MSKGVWFAVGMATLVAGTLDILWAFVIAGIEGAEPIQVLRFVASGPFGNVTLRGGGGGGGGWAALGLLVHFIIIACMVGAYMGIAQRYPVLLRHAVLAGLAYGVLLWLFMYWVVMPLRWPDAPLPHTLYEMATALFAHCVLVGLPISLIAARTFRDDNVI